MTAAPRADSGMLAALVGDGRPPLAVTALGLILAGGFALFLGVTGQFLPHDVGYLAMTPDQLCGVNECRVVHFMVHDRVSFGGALVAIGILYLWLVLFPLAAGERWAWWVLAVSGAEGFLSFLAYLGTGYLDTWHAVATAALLPCFLIGLIRSRRLLHAESGGTRTRGLGQLCLLAAGCGLVGAGATILTVGMTTVFVPEDLQFMGITPNELNAVNPRLIPLIAHDRAGFGGAVVCCGLLTLGVAWFGRPTLAWRQALAAAGLVGWGCAIGVHPAIGYTDWWHLLPACTGAALWFVGLLLSCSGKNFASGTRQGAECESPLVRRREIESD
jgi:hypothetical protein